MTLVRCRKCRRLWLRYFIENEAFSRSGRWAMAVIDEQTVAALTPETAVAVIEGAHWHVFGGSFFDHAGKRGHGRLTWL